MPGLAHAIGGVPQPYSTSAGEPMSFRTYTCPISRHCGGCEWLAVPYPIQLRRKQSMMEELLGPVAGRDGARLGRIHGMEEPVSFRHKAATPFSPTRGGAIRSGFYAAGTHRIVDCDACLVEDPRARPILNDVACICAQVGIHAYQEDRGRGILRHAVVRCGYATDDILLTLVTPAPTNWWRGSCAPTPRSPPSCRT